MRERHGSRFLIPAFFDPAAVETVQADASVPNSHDQAPNGIPPTDESLSGLIHQGKAPATAALAVAAVRFRTKQNGTVSLVVPRRIESSPDSAGQEPATDTSASRSPRVVRMSGELVQRATCGAHRPRPSPTFRNDIAFSGEQGCRQSHIILGRVRGGSTRARSQPTVEAMPSEGDKMPSALFLKELQTSSPGDRVTGIVTWQRFCEGSEPAAGAATVMEDAKRPLLRAARDCPDTRVDPLAGMPQAILDAPVDSWRRLLNIQPALLAGEDLVVDANVRVFSTPP